MKKFFAVLKKSLAVFISFLLISADVIIIASAVYLDSVKREVSEYRFPDLDLSSPATIYYYDFKDRKNRIGDAYPLDDGEMRGMNYRIFTPIDTIPKHLKDAFIAIEDKRFYSHNGVDYKRTAAAVVNFYTSVMSGFGASTITQQLIKNLTGNDELTKERKTREIFMALEYEREHTKDEILEKYLNIINLSHGCIGVGAAAKTYFSKEVSDLDLCESACIAAITNNPTLYDPINSPGENKRRRQLILSEMYKQGLITEAEYNDAYYSDPVIKQSKDGVGKYNSWYVDAVISDVIADLSDKYKIGRDAAERMLLYGNLKIYTAIDRDIQRVVDRFYENEKNFTLLGAERPDSAMVIMDHETGDILAIAGGVGKKTGNRVFGLATDSLRPPGSALKPLSVYAPGLEKKKLHWAWMYEDSPVIEQTLENGEKYVWPQNANHRYRGRMSVSEAIKYSTNTVSVKALYDVGLSSSYSFLKNGFGLNTLRPKTRTDDGDMNASSLALGQLVDGVSVRDMTTAYCAFSDGSYKKSRTYIKVCDALGNVILENKIQKTKALSEQNAYIMTEMLEGVTESGTAWEMSLNDEVAVAGKTGTTSGDCDKWFIGYTPEYAGGVWYGYRYPKELKGVKGNPSVRIFDRVMKEVYRVKGVAPEKAEFQIPHGVEELSFCRDSGMIPTERCAFDERGDRIDRGWFSCDNRPFDFCNNGIHEHMGEEETHIIETEDDIKGDEALWKKSDQIR